MKKGIIIGAGIALAQKGIDVTIYEQAPEIKAVGSGIWMAANALKIFEKLGVDGNVALLGDAAHATTPNLGQGACQAVEDAFSIAEELSKT